MLFLGGLLFHTLSRSFIMIMQVPKILFVALVSHAFLKSASADVEIFTNETLWRAAVAAADGSSCISTDDFEDGYIPLVNGESTDMGLFDVYIDPILFPVVENALGQIGGVFVGAIGPSNIVTPTVVKFHQFDNAPVIAVGGYWVGNTIQ
jgi:zona occludens toxin (predicted ATPase)